jgi:hypothetical protein
LSDDFSKSGSFALFKIIEKLSDPTDELELNLIDVEFLVVEHRAISRIWSGWFAD